MLNYIFAFFTYYENEFEYMFKIFPFIYRDINIIFNICQHLQKNLDEMDTETFEKNKEALATKRLEKPKKLRTQHNKYLGEISNQTYNFDRGIIILSAYILWK